MAAVPPHASPRADGMNRLGTCPRVAPRDTSARSPPTPRAAPPRLGLRGRITCTIASLLHRSNQAPPHTARLGTDRPVKTAGYASGNVNVTMTGFGPDSARLPRHSPLQHGCGFAFGSIWRGMGR